MIQSGSADFLLATLADLLINPELTLDIVRLFRPLLLDLTHRRVIMQCMLIYILNNTIQVCARQPRWCTGHHPTREDLRRLCPYRPVCSSDTRVYMAQHMTTAHSPDLRNVHDYFTTVKASPFERLVRESHAAITEDCLLVQWHDAIPL